MPLTVSLRPGVNTLWITGTVRPAGHPAGVRVRRRAGTDEIRLAREEAAALEAEILRNAHHGERRRTVGFKEAIESYIAHEPRTRATLAFLLRLGTHFGDIPLSQITQEAADRARAALFDPDASPATIRRGLFTPLSAVLNHAAHPARRWCDPPRFDVPAETRGRIEFMWPDQVERLIACAEDRVRPLFVFLFCTGCRMSEALSLTWDRPGLLDGQVVLQEADTKGGGRRVVLIPPRAVEALREAAVSHWHAENRNTVGVATPPCGPVFRTHLGTAYRNSDNGGGQVRRAWATACRRAEVPAGFTPHHARHTWASWHYALHRDLLRLKREGGWQTMRMVENYAHLMPAGHEAAIRRVWGI